MKISLQWLRRHVDTDRTPEEIAAHLVQRGLEVEEIQRPGALYDKFVVGDVLSVTKHPNASKLTLCLVDVGVHDAPLQIVCGAPNVRDGQKVPVGLVGAVVPKNQHDPDGKPFTLAKVKLRGEDSNGMICSEYELGKGANADGIMVLDATAVPGTPLAQYFGLNDVVFEIGVTPNRPDCLSHIGVARELAASLSTPLKNEKLVVIESANEKTSPHITVTIENKEGCPRYAARIIKDLFVAESPRWLQDLLRSAGIRPINNVVDATNFIMYDHGQPLHAFDYEKLAGQTIIVKNAAEGSNFTTLDGVQRRLSQSDLMICDAHGPVAIAGVMGGLNSEISSTTKTILLESAYFSPTYVRKTSKRLSMSTDASQRFERGIDPNGTRTAVDRVAALIQQLAGGLILQDAVDEYPVPIKPMHIDLRCSRANKILGTDLTIQNIGSYLESIEIRTDQTSDDVLHCVVPTFRPDLVQEIDLIEEVARLYGYDKIDDKMVSTIDYSQPINTVEQDMVIRRWFESNGFNEIITSSLIDEKNVSLFSDNFVKVANPISRDFSILRPSSLPSILQTVFFNQNYGKKDLRLFEIGRIYRTAGSNELVEQVIPGYHEKKVLSLCLTGRRASDFLYSDASVVDIFDIKGIVQSFLNKILLDKICFIYYDTSSSLTDETIGIEINGTYAGFVGRIKPESRKAYQVEKDVYVAELTLSTIEQKERAFRKYFPISKYPSITRDLAFVLNDDIKVEVIQSKIVAAGGSLLKSIVLFDIYKGKNLPDGKKSIAFSLEFNSSEKTLLEEDVHSLIAAIIEVVIATFGAELRTI